MYNLEELKEENMIDIEAIDMSMPEE